MRNTVKDFFWLGGSESYEYTTEVQAWLDRISALGYTAPPTGFSIALDQFVIALKLAGFYNNVVRALFFCAGGQKEVGLVDLVNPTSNTSSFDGTFDPEDWHSRVGLKSYNIIGKRGKVRQVFKSDAVSPSSLTFIQYMPVWTGYDTVGTAARSHGHTTNSAGTAASALIPKFTSPANGYGYVSSASNEFTNSKHSGLYIVTYGGGQVVVYKDGVKDGATLSQTTPNISIDRAIHTQNAATSSGSWSPITDTYDRYISFDIILNIALNDSQEATLRGLINTFVTDASIGNYLTDYDGVLPAASHCWFTREKAVYHAGSNKTFFGSVHNDGTGYTQWICQLDHATGVVTKTKIGTFTEWDDHNEPSIVIRASDSKIFVAYTEHGHASTRLIRTRISTNALDISSFGAEVTYTPDTLRYTYCNAFQVVNGDIYIFYRENDASIANWAYIKSTDGGATFGAKTTFWDKHYLNITQNQSDKDIIHFIGSWHPIDAVAANKVNHFYFDAGAGTWHKSDGTDVTGSLPLTDASTTAIFEKTDPEQVWIEDLFLDASGYPRALMTYFPNRVTTFKTKYLYYTEWNGSAWSTPHEIHLALDRDISVGSPIGEVTYSGLACFDRANPNRIFASKETSGVCEIFELTRNSASSFTSTQKTFNSKADQWRPFTTNAPNRNVFWLHQVKYDSYVNNYFQVLIAKTL